MTEAVPFIQAGLAAASFIPGIGAFAAIASLALGVVSQMFLRDTPSNDSSLRGAGADQLRTLRSADEPRRIIYGETRVGGTLAFASSRQIDNRWLYLIVAYAAHEVESFGSVYFNETEILQSDLAEGGEGEPRDVITGEYAQSSPGNPVATIVFQKGSPGQVANSWLIGELGDEWDSSRVGNNVAYIGYRLIYFRDVYPQGIPNPTVVAKGRKVWDPRDGGQVWNDPSTHTWSENAALCILDCLLNQDFGVGADISEIDQANFISQANICDEMVQADQASPPTMQKRYTINGSFQLDEDRQKVLNDMMASVAGELTYIMGTYRLFVGAYQTPIYTITESDLAGEITVTARPPRKDLFNTIRGTFMSREERWVVTDFPIRTNDTFKTEDGGIELVREIEMPFVDDPLRAQRIAEIALRRHRQGIQLTLPCKWTVLDTASSDTVNVTLAKFGWTDKIFRILNWDMREDRVIMLSLQEDDSTSYDWDAGEALTYDPAADTNLPNPKDIDPPSNVTFDSGDDQLTISASGAVVSSILVAWTPPQSIFVFQGGAIEIQWRVRDREIPDWTGPDVFTEYAIGSHNCKRLTNVSDGVTYDIRLRSLSQWSRTPSDRDDEVWQQTFTHTVIGKTTPPPPPDSFTVSENPNDGTRSYSWLWIDAPLDVRNGRGGVYLKIGASGVTDWDSMAWLHTPNEPRTQSPFQTFQPPAGTYSVACRGVDSSGNESETIFVEHTFILSGTEGDLRAFQNSAQAGWPGTIENGFLGTIGPEANSNNPWDSQGAWDSLPQWTDPATLNNPLRYATNSFDCGSAGTKTPFVTINGKGTLTAEMRTSNSDPPTGAWGPLGTFSERYAEFRASSDDASGGALYNVIIEVVA